MRWSAPNGCIQNHRARQGTFGAEPSQAHDSESLEYPEFVTFRKRSQNAGDEDQEIKPDKAQTPEEQLAAAYKVLRDSLSNDVLETVKQASPAFFEQVVIDLLVTMGYGGSI